MGKPLGQIGGFWIGFDLDRFLAEAGDVLSVWRVAVRSDGMTVVKILCPFNEAHRDGAADIRRVGNGPIEARCYHHSCDRFGWGDLVEKVAPGWRTRPARLAKFFR